MIYKEYYIQYIPQGSLATIGLDGALGGPVPILFSAETRNSYSVVSTRSVMLSVSSGRRSLLTRTHLVLAVVRRSNQ